MSVKDSLELLSKNSSKGVSLREFTKYIGVALSVQEYLWLEFFKPRWSRQRLRTHGGKKRVVANFFNRIEKDNTSGKETVIAYGSAKFAPGGKREISVPTTIAFKEYTYRFKTLVVDEFLTTRVCYEDGSILQAVEKWKNFKEIEVRG